MSLYRLAREPEERIRRKVVRAGEHDGDASRVSRPPARPADAEVDVPEVHADEHRPEAERDGSGFRRHRRWLLSCYVVTESSDPVCENGVLLAK
jgi:hypothetical protein